MAETASFRDTVSIAMTSNGEGGILSGVVATESNFGVVVHKR